MINIITLLAPVVRRTNISYDYPRTIFNITEIAKDCAKIILGQYLALRRYIRIILIQYLALRIYLMIILRQ